MCIRSITRAEGRGAGSFPGFTFTEVIFAVILLGLGFILVAGMFPVAIQQTAATVEETAAAGLGPAGARMVQRLANSDVLPATGAVGQRGQVVSFRSTAPAVWDALRPSLIASWDTRYAWVPMYRRDFGDNFAQVIVVVVKSRLRGGYQGSLDYLRQPSDSGSNPATLEPRDVTVTISSGAGALPDSVTVSGPDADAVGPGAFLIVAEDSNAGRGNGQAVRVGRQTGPNSFELQPGGDLKQNVYKLAGGRALVVGRGWSDPANPGPPAGYEGPAQDVAVYSTFIRLN